MKYTKNYGESMINNFSKLTKEIKELLKDSFIIGFKKSLEDEGSSFKEVSFFKRLSNEFSLDIFVKIGGCEAKNDINFCIEENILNVIPPMIESKYAIKKHLEYTKGKGLNTYFLCETKNAVKNIEEILSLHKEISGVIVGRSDLAGSFELKKDDTNSDFIFNQVKKVFKSAKDLNLTTTLGGNISFKSVKFIEDLYELNIIDKVETRNCVIEINDNSIKNLEEIINKALLIETKIIEYQSLLIKSRLKEKIDRIKNINNRISNKKFNNFNTIQKKDFSKNIAIDFDGVIHRNSKGFHDGTIYDEPIEGAIASLREIKKLGYNIIIYSCKSNSDRPLVEGKTGTELIWEWVKEKQIENLIDKISNEKPRALIYIDDKGFNFKNWNETIEFIRKIK